MIEENSRWKGTQETVLSACSSGGIRPGCSRPYQVSLKNLQGWEFYILFGQTDPLLDCPLRGKVFPHNQSESLFNFLVIVSCSPTMHLKYSRAQNWMQYSRCGLSSAV